MSKLLPSRMQPLLAAGIVLCPMNSSTLRTLIFYCSCPHLHCFASAPPNYSPTS